MSRSPVTSRTGAAHRAQVERGRGELRGEVVHEAFGALAHRVEECGGHLRLGAGDRVEPRAGATASAVLERGCGRGRVGDEQGTDHLCGELGTQFSRGVDHAQASFSGGGSHRGVVGGRHERLEGNQPADDGDRPNARRGDGADGERPTGAGRPGEHVDAVEREVVEEVDGVGREGGGIAAGVGGAVAEAGSVDGDEAHPRGGGDGGVRVSGEARVRGAVHQEDRRCARCARFAYEVGGELSWGAVGGAQREEEVGGRGGDLGDPLHVRCAGEVGWVVARPCRVGSRHRHDGSGLADARSKCRCHPCEHVSASV